jgi:ribulose-5-phosphate 4-epimerase/fuculose-1-phosphate aldolase
MTALSLKSKIMNTLHYEQSRIQLAAAYQALALFGMEDMVATHLSVRSNDGKGFWLPPFGYLYEEINIQQNDFLNEESQYYDEEATELVEDIIATISTSMV